MPEILIGMGIIGLLSAIIGSLIALRIEHRSLESIHTRQQAWERAQVSRQWRWETLQKKHIVQFETKLTGQLEQIQTTWRTWEANDAARVEALTQQHETAVTQWHLERELARLPRIEEAPLLANGNGQQQRAFPDWQAAMLQRANLQERDLSHRYLGHANLREAQLSGTHFYMADLSGASLAGANLSGADLSGANLTTADLRGANLTGANLLVADLHNAILLNANLLGVRNLTPEQVWTAIYDGTTQLDPEIDVTLPRPRISIVLPKTPTTPAPTEAPGLSSQTPDSSTEAMAAVTAASSAQTPLPESLPDMPPLMQKSPEPVALLPLSSDDSQPDPVATNLPADKTENRYTEESGRATPRQGYKDKRRAKAN
jgi:hypothetical protein